MNTAPAYHASLVTQYPLIHQGKVRDSFAIDEDHMMIDADVIDGRKLQIALFEAFDNPDVAYIHLHNAKPGCFAAEVVRAPQ